MPSRKRKSSKFKKVAIEWLKWTSAIVPILAFIYILYYYKQLDFLKKNEEVKSVTTVLDAKDSAKLAEVIQKNKINDNIKIVENEWHLVGGIAIHNMLVENKSTQSAKSFEAEFKYLSDTQEALTTKVITIKRDLPAGKSTKITDLSVGFVNNGAVGCDTKVITAKF
ncbi:hypothetical protein [Dyadobacter diqingensis]|jgi:hypothetical protein|uniref:hypothetical protein n=1 Tax=Dyadobacter diqingensis TaxID=2938121 RepID=UPI0020C4CB8D|nr:hypothetical protein [Dyadobacter diqingensis]